MTREELIEVTGQVVNGMLSADSSLLTKVVDRTVHAQIAESAVGVAFEILKNIDKYYRY